MLSGMVNVRCETSGFSPIDGTDTLSGQVSLCHHEQRFHYCTQLNHMTRLIHKRALKYHTFSKRVNERIDERDEHLTIR